jgi:hypothetical protein
MFRRFIIFGIITCLFTANCSRFFVYAGFEANQKYIAQNLCINKNRPCMQCNGHCYLMKKLKQAEEKEKKQEREEQKSRYQEALPNNPATISFKAPVIPVTYPAYLPQALAKRVSAIFHPPQIV